ncbi:MAG: S9 family peptidase [Aquabacterium sp.]
MTGPSLTPQACGSWASPLSALALTSAAQALAMPRWDAEDLFALQVRPAEGGRVALMRWRGGGGQPECLTPAPLNLRSRVHEYGGGAFAVQRAKVVFCDLSDQRVYLLDLSAAGSAVAITDASPRRHADFEIDTSRGCVYAVQEDHGAEGEPRCSIVALALDGGAPPRELVTGHDFYSSPRLSADGRRLAWLCWRHPDMPWDATELWCADVDGDANLHNARRLAGGRGESLCTPRWHADGTLYVVSDASGWWNLHRVGAQGLEPVAPMPAECGEPMWTFGQSLWDFDGPAHAWLAAIHDGESRLWRVALSNGALTRVELSFNDLEYLHARHGEMAVIAASPVETAQLIRVRADGSWQAVARNTELQPDPAGLSVPRTIRYASGDGRREAHAFFYPPAHAGCQPMRGERPPLVVMSHGGPTGQSTASLRLSVQYWTSRGIAVLDVNYGGSTGYGRAYRRLLEGQWGLVDVEDCVAGARWLADQGLVDADRMAIRGGSASGYTVLRALMFHDVFKAGASHYGVADLKALDADTHKFESRYLQSLICPPHQRDDVYAQRSPIHHVQRLNCPMLFLQGLEDRVVPPSQSRVMVESLRARGVPVTYIEFEGEGHGFRQPDNQRRALEAELAFYGQVFGFVPAPDLPPA